MKMHVSVVIGENFNNKCIACSDDKKALKEFADIWWRCVVPHDEVAVSYNSLFARREHTKFDRDKVTVDFECTPKEARAVTCILTVALFWSYGLDNEITLCFQGETSSLCKSVDELLKVTLDTSECSSNKYKSYKPKESMTTDIFIGAVRRVERRKYESCRFYTCTLF